MLPVRVRIALRIQRVLAHVLFPLVGGVIVAVVRLRGHRIDGQELSDVRNKFAELTRGHRGPLFICGNHLTMVDSAFVAWALASNWSYFWNFKHLAWSLPEWRNFGSSLALRVVCYLTKCVPILRNGTPEEKRRSLAKLEYLLQRGEAISIFPEGTRSRTGRLDTESLGYGVGMLAMRVENPLVLCVYLRGLQQTGITTMPARGDRIYVDLCAIRPETESRGLRGARDIAIQIMNELVELEKKYSSNGDGPAPTPHTATLQDTADPIPAPSTLATEVQ